MVNRSVYILFCRRSVAERSVISTLARALSLACIRIYSLFHKTVYQIFWRNFSCESTDTMPDIYNTLSAPELSSTYSNLCISQTYLTQVKISSTYYCYCSLTVSKYLCNLKYFNTNFKIFSFQNSDYNLQIIYW